MSNKREIDQLFASRLENARVAPSAAAWAQLEGNLQQGKRKRLWYSIAAAITLLMASVFSWLFIDGLDDANPAFSAVSSEFQKAPYPKQTDLSGMDFSSIISEKLALVKSASEKKSQIPVQPKQSARHLPDSNAPIPKVIEQVIAATEKEDMIEITEQTTKATEEAAIALNVDQVSPEKVAQSAEDKVEEIVAAKVESEELVEEKILEELPAVSITYLAKSEAEKEVKENKSKGKFSLKKVFKSAKKLANGDLIAEFREAKDGLIDSGIKSLND